MTSQHDQNGNFQVIAARGIVINNNNEVLFVSEDNNNWHLPGGWIETLEDPLSACKREVYEETGLIIEPQKIIYITEFIEKPTEIYKQFKQKFDLYCYCTIIGSQEIDHKWIDPDNSLIKYRKFVSNNEWKNSKNLYAPTKLKQFDIQDISKTPSCYNKI